MTFLQDKSSRIWKIRYRGADGKVHEISTGQTSRSQAKKVTSLAQIRELEMAAQVGVVQRAALETIVVGKRLIVSEVIEEWLKWLESIGKSPFTISNYAAALRKWAADTASERMLLFKLEESAIDTWVNQPTPIKAGQRNVILSAFKSLFTFAAAKGWVTRNPASLVVVKMNQLTHEQKETKQRHLFTEEMIETILAKTEVGSFWHAAVALGAYTGLRLGDICSLQWPCFSEDRAKMKVWTDKANTPVFHPVDAPEPLRKAIEAIPVVDDVWCFPEQRAMYIDPRRHPVLCYTFKRMLDRMNIEDRTFHCFRHTYATRHHKSGKDLFVIKADLGHKSVETTKGYIH